MEADTTIYGESMNTRIPPFDNVEIRRAVAAAIDREHLVMVQPSRMSALTQALTGDITDTRALVRRLGTTGPRRARSLTA